MRKLNSLYVILVVLLLYFGYPVLQEHSPAFVGTTAFILVLGYPLYIAVLYKKGQRSKVIFKSILWFTGWCFAIVAFDMFNPLKSYQFGPLAFLFSVPASALIGAVVGFIVWSILPSRQDGSTH